MSEIRDTLSDIKQKEFKRKVSIGSLPLEIGEPTEEVEKYCRSWRGWRAPGEHDPPNQLSRDHMDSQSRKQEAQESSWVCTRFSDTCYGC